MVAKAFQLGYVCKVLVHKVTLTRVSAGRHMASPASMTSDEEQNWVDGTAASYEFVRFTLSDMHGISRSKLIPRRHVDKYLKTGMTLCVGIVSAALLIGNKKRNGRNRTAFLAVQTILQHYDT